MTIAFLFVTVFFGMFITYIWNSKTLLNLAIKIAMSFYTLWAILMLLAAVWPYVNNGKMQVF